MTLHRLTVAVALLFGCVLVLPGCGAADTAINPSDTTADETAVTRGSAAAAESASESRSSIATTTTGLFRVCADGKWGFIDSNGTIKIEPEFETAYFDFSEGLAPVDPEGPPYRFGYIDASGRMVIEPQFASAGQFVEGMAEVGDRDQGDGGKWGAIDRSGSLVVPMQYDSPPLFSEGLAAVRSDGAWYFIDKTGATALGPFKCAGNFSEGLAYVDWGDGRGFIDKDGARVIELPDGLTCGDWPEKGFSEGLAAVRSQVGDTILWGYVDTAGKLVIDPQYASASAFSESLAGVAIQVGRETKCGFIDKAGRWVIEPQFHAVFPFSEGLATVMCLEKYAGVADFESYGYIDKTGALVIPRQYSEAASFLGGLARVVSRDAQSGSPTYIDKSGKVIWRGR
jgi:hypothetical protein